MTVEQFLNCGKNNVLIMSKPNASESIAYFEYRAENQSTCQFISQIKSILYSVENLSTDIKLLIHDNNKSLFILNQIYRQKL